MEIKVVDLMGAKFQCFRSCSEQGRPRPWFATVLLGHFRSSCQRPIEAILLESSSHRIIKEISIEGIKLRIKR